MFKDFILAALDFDEIAQVKNEGWGIHPEDHNLIKKVASVVDLNRFVNELPKTQRILTRPSLDDLFSRSDRSDLCQRNSMIATVFNIYGYTQEEIGGYLDLHRTTISRIVNTFKS